MSSFSLWWQEQLVSRFYGAIVSFLMLTCDQCFPLLVCSTHHLGEDLFLMALHSMFWQGKMTCALDDLDHD